MKFTHTDTQLRRWKEQDDLQVDRLILDEKMARFCKMYNNICLVAISTAMNGRFTLQIGAGAKEVWDFFCTLRGIAIQRYCRLYSYLKAVEFCVCELRKSFHFVTLCLLPWSKSKVEKVQLVNAPHGILFFTPSTVDIKLKHSFL